MLAVFCLKFCFQNDAEHQDLIAVQEGAEPVETVTGATTTEG